MENLSRHFFRWPSASVAGLNTAVRSCLSMVLASSKLSALRSRSQFAVMLACIAFTFHALSAVAQDISLTSAVTLTPAVTLVLGEGWSSVPPRAGEAAVLQLRGANGRVAGRAIITISSWRTAEAAAAQIVLSVPSEGVAPTVFEIAGWPAVTITEQIEPDEPEGTERVGPPESFTRIVTLVATDKDLLRISITLRSNASPDLLLRARKLVEGLRISKPAASAETRRRVPALRASLRIRGRKMSARPTSSAQTRGGARIATNRVKLEPSTANNAGPGRELEIVVSPDGLDIVIAGNNANRDGIFTSNDGGRSFAQESFPMAPVPNGTGFRRRGDPSVVRGPSGRFYVSYLGEEQFPESKLRQTVSIAVSEPNDRGKNFSFLSHATRCADNDVFTTDQPHLAVDPRIRSGRPDQVYVGWRRNRPLDETITCSDAMSGFDTMVTCSADGGATWATTTFIDDYGMYPRLTVGHDGMVYVVTQQHRYDGTIFLTKLSSCEDGLQIQKPGFPSAIPFDGINLGVPGLDRNNRGNILASPTVAVDPAHLCHVYIAYANRTGAGNEDIVVRGSLDGGETWTLQTTANSPNIPGRRYMPWLCAAPEQLFVSWYDRRGAVSSADDRTRYFVSLIRPVDDTGESMSYSLSRIFETSVSPVPDPQCRIWPVPPWLTTDATRCEGRQLAGDLVDRNTGSSVTDASGSSRCDFTETPANPEHNCIPRRGQPKYGDYTGNACLPGRAFLTWASATNPQSGAEFDHTRTFFATVDAMNLNIVQDLCSEKRCGGFEPGDPGELFLRCPNGDCRLVFSMPELCKSFVKCPSCDTGAPCFKELNFEVDGLDRSWVVRLVGEDGVAVNNRVQRTTNGFAFAVRPPMSQAINGRVGRYYLVLDRNEGVLGVTVVRLRVSPSTP